MSQPGLPEQHGRLTLTSFGVRHPVPANLLMWAIIIAGLIFGVNLRRELFPDLTPEAAVVTVPYPGASPSDIEESLVRKIEDKIADLDEVDEITSTIAEGIATLIVEFRDGIGDIDRAVDEIESAIETLQDLPEDSERITTAKLEPIFPIIAVSLYGDAGETELKRAARQMQDDMKLLPGMGDVLLTGARTDEIRVEVHPGLLLKYGLSLPQVSDAVTRWMAEIPGGTVRTGTSSIRVRTMGVEEAALDVAQIPILSTPQGGVVRVGDVATVRDTFEDIDIAQRMNGEPALRLTALNIGEGDAIEIAELVRAYAAGRAGKEGFEPHLADRWHAFVNGMKRSSYERRLSEYEAAVAGGEETGEEPAPPALLKSARRQAYEMGASHPDPPPGDLVLHNDLARFIEGRLSLVTRNAMYGSILVFVILLLALNVRVALWVMLGLVVSLLGTLAFMALMDYTLNLLTMFGLIIVIGLLVDDAIVVAENIVARHEAGEPALSAAINGASEIAWPVVATVMTTIAAFVPLALVEGQIGDFLGALPAVVACALLVSLTESLLILPAHMGHSLKKDETRQPGRIGSLLARYEAGRDRFVQERVLPGFGRLLDRLITYRYVTFAAAVGIWLISVGMVMGRRADFTFFAGEDSEIFVVNLEMPVGTPLEVTDGVISKVEQACLAEPEVADVEALIGISLNTEDWNPTEPRTHIAQLYVELKLVEEREQTSAQIIASIRERLGPMTGVTALKFEEIQGGPGGEDINIVVAGDSEGAILAAASDLKRKLGEFAGVVGIDDNADRGQRELQIRLHAGAAALGFTASEVARQVRGAVFGLEAHTFAEDREEVKVRVILDEASRRSIGTIEHLFVRSPAGHWVPLSEVAEVSERTGYSTIHRLNRERAITVTAEVQEAVNNPERVVGSLLPYFEELRGRYPGVSVEARGRQLETTRSLSSLRTGFLVASILIYIILAWLFGSYYQPLAVMLAIPFSMIGVIWGHYLLGFDLTILSLIGFVALSGIVVNDSLILVQFYNYKRADGLSVHEALVSAGMQRLRPILLTTVTTVFGLLPLILEQSFQARVLIPMALSISFGLISATALILVVLPALIVIGNDLGWVGVWLWTGRWEGEMKGGGELF